MSKGLSYNFFGTKGDIVATASSLPSDPAVLMKNGWEDITPDGMKGTGHTLLSDTNTGLRIRFDKGVDGANGFRGKDHYHILNPNATSNKDMYLDENGDPVAKNSKKSHILPKGGK